MSSIDFPSLAKGMQRILRDERAMRQKAEAAQQQAEADKQHAEAERGRQEQALRDEIAKRKHADADKLRVEGEKQRAEAEVKRLKDLTGIVIDWTCETDTGILAYDSMINEAIEAGYQHYLISKAGRGSHDVAFVRDGIPYCANFVTMKQMRIDGG